MCPPVWGGALDALKAKLPIAWIGEKIHYYPSLESTNDRAMQLAADGAPHGTLVVADEQTHGKGRDGKVWITRPGTSLAFSLILRSTLLNAENLHRFIGLGAIAVVDGLGKTGLNSSIKWPNDVLVNDKKIAGVLLEGSWRSERIEFATLGIGINVDRGSIQEDDRMDYPAISVSEALGSSVNRESLLIDILEALAGWYPRVSDQDFVSHWDTHLAYKGDEVILGEETAGVRGKLIGLDRNGSLQIDTERDGVVNARHQSSLRRYSVQPE